MVYLKASGEKIREARKSAKLTQAQLGEKLHVSGSMVGQYETEARRPSIKTAKEIAAILGIDARSLLVEFEADDLTLVPASTVALAEIEQAKVRVIPTDLYGPSISTMTPKDRIVTALGSLNDDGQQKAVERVEELTEIPRYQAAAAPEAPQSSGADSDTSEPENPEEGPPEAQEC